MTDPVRLPSGMIMDRKVIEQQLLNKPVMNTQLNRKILSTDPF